MTQYPAAIWLGDLDGDNGFRLNGGAAYDFNGNSVASAGDINGDGFADIMIGTSAADPNGSSSGSTYVIFGKVGGFAPTMDPDDLDGTNGFRLDGVAANDAAGRSVASAGDVNGDGFDDMIIGAPAADPPGASSGGASYVVFGKASGFDATLNLGDLDGANGFRIDASVTNGRTGEAVASAGDINGDGFDDLVVGAPAIAVGSNPFGGSYVVFGHGGGFAAAVDLADLDGTNGFAIAGVTGDTAGSSVASAGDINRDGFDDLLIGSSNSDATYVVFGKASGFDATLDLEDLDGANGFRFQGVDLSSLGFSVASAGDINGDGFDDIVLGAYSAKPHGQSSGSTYVVFGHRGGFAATVDVTTLDGTDGFRLDGAMNEFSGRTVASAGDVNGDGFDDLIIGAMGSSARYGNAGATYVVFGKASGFAATMDLSTVNGTNGFRIDGVANSDNSGWSVASAGDVNADGLDDMVVSAERSSVGGHFSGASYIIFGRLPDTAVVRSGTEASQSLVGGDLNDLLKARGGDDRLWGHDGADKVMGGSGDDTLVGGGGRDKLGGQAGADTFIFQAASDSPDQDHADLIKDLAANDKIDLSAIDADTTLAGDQAFHLVAAFGGHAGELVLTGLDEKGKHSWLMGDTDGDGDADFTVKLTGDHHDFAGLVL